MLCEELIGLKSFVPNQNVVAYSFIGFKFYQIKQLTRTVSKKCVNSVPNIIVYSCKPVMVGGKRRFYKLYLVKNYLHIIDYISI